MRRFEGKEIPHTERIPRLRTPDRKGTAMHLVAKPVFLLLGHDRKKNIIPQRWRSNYINVRMMWGRQLK